MFYTYPQNNSGGSFNYSTREGITEFVIVEANNADHANERAEEIGIYFDGCSVGADCSCCGDRWYKVSESDATEEPMVHTRSFYSDKCPVDTAVHYLGGTIIWKQV